MNTESREYKAAKQLEDAINDMGWNPKAFAQECKDACKQSGISQSEVFRNAMQETINKVK